MFTYQILVEYDGSNFSGWQIQKNASSIQEVIQKILEKIFKKKIKLFGSGRTDNDPFFNPFSVSSIDNKYPPRKAIVKKGLVLRLILSIFIVLSKHFSLKRSKYWP